MIKNGVGGSNTKTGLKFEERTDVVALLRKKEGYEIKDDVIYYNGKEVARSYKKDSLYKFLKSKDVDYKKIISKKLLPDQALFVLANKTMFIIEIKFQNVAGSVDEKLQTCDFKRKQYTKLFSPLSIEVEYIYVLNNWFNKPEYKDVLDYINSVGCHYYFEVLPLEKLGLPVLKTE